MSDRICLGCRELRPRAWFLDGRQPCHACRGLDTPEPVVVVRRMNTADRGRHLRRLTRAQGGRCFYCNVRMTKRGVNKRTIDHKVPRSRAGGNGANLVAACEPCNHAKGSMTAEQYRRSPQLAARRRKLAELERRRLAHDARGAA